MNAVQIVCNFWDRVSKIVQQFHRKNAADSSLAFFLLPSLVLDTALELDQILRDLYLLPSLSQQYQLLELLKLILSSFFTVSFTTS